MRRARCDSDDFAPITHLGLPMVIGTNGHYTAGSRESDCMATPGAHRGDVPPLFESNGRAGISRSDHPSVLQ